MAIYAYFAPYIFGTFTFKATIIILYYVAPQWLFIDAETDDLEWSFCVNWSELGIQWAGVLAFGEKYSEICRATHITVSATKMQPSDSTGDKCYGVIHWGYKKRKCQTSGLYLLSLSQFAYMLFTDACRK